MLSYAMQDNANRIIEEGAKRFSSQAFIDHEILRTKTSKEWKWMIAGNDYFDGRHEILKKQRTVIGEGGNIEVVDNLPNNKLIDNVYKRMVMQKTNYLFGKPFTVSSNNDQYTELLNGYFDKDFMRKMKNIGKDQLNCGIAWLYIHYNEKGELCFRRFKPYEIIPEWKDVDHTELDSVIRFYNVEIWDGQIDRKITRIEHYTTEGIDFYEDYSGIIAPCKPYHLDYMQVNGNGFNWDRLPFVAFKYNQEEIPLIVNCKSLQDGLNNIVSNFQNNMEEDARNTILVLVNYDGENLGQFRRNLAQYGAVKVRSSEGGNGDVKTLSVEVNHENYKALIDIFKRAIVENCMGFDAKDARLNGNPNQMNIQSMYSDIDLDASDTETECQAAMDELLYFVDLHLMNTGMGDFTKEEVTFTFNTDLPMDESTTIANIRNSEGIISDETLVAKHPWVDDVQEELDRIKKQKEENMETFGGIFESQQDDVTDEQ